MRLFGRHRRMEIVHRGGFVWEGEVGGSNRKGVCLFRVFVVLNGSYSVGYRENRDHSPEFLPVWIIDVAVPRFKIVQAIDLLWSSCYRHFSFNLTPRYSINRTNCFILANIGVGITRQFLVPLLRDETATCHFFPFPLPSFESHNTSKSYNDLIHTHSTHFQYILINSRLRI
jgi:hypothetical protein